jgi:1-deoxy-D-xylulose-5-phosphate synthase
MNFGALIKTAEEVAQELNATLLDMRFVKPLDKELMAEHSNGKKAIITIEDGAISGGAGSAVSEWAQENKMKQQIIICGIPDKFVDHASRDEMLEMTGLDTKGILTKVEDCLS